MTSHDQAYRPRAEREPSDLPRREETVSLGFLSLFWRRRWVTLACVVAGTGLAVAAGKFLPNKYTASALVIFEPHRTQVLESKAGAEQEDVEERAIATLMEILNSRTLLADVAKDLRLARDPEFGGGPQAPRQPWQARVWQTLGSMVAAVWPSSPSFAHDEASPPAPAALGPAPPVLGPTPVPAPDPAPGPDTASARVEEVIESLTHGLRVAQQGEAHIIKVSFTSEDPAKAALIANSMANHLVAYQLQTIHSDTSNMSDWLEGRLADLRGEIEAAAKAEQAFRAQNGLMVANGVDVSDQELAEVAQAAVAARAEAAEKLSKITLISKFKPGQSQVDAIREVIASPLIVTLRTQETELLRQEAELRATYGNKHPQIQLMRQERAMINDKVRREIDRIVDNLKLEAQAAAARQASVEQDVERVKASMVKKRQAEVQLAELQRETEASRQIYQQLLQRYKETRQQQKIIEPDVRLLSAAEAPYRPSTPGTVFFAMIGFTGSLLLSSLLVLLREGSDSTLRGAGDIEHHLGLARIGMLPALGRLGSRQRPHHYLLAKPRSPYASALQAIARQLKTGALVPKLVLVTSSLPQEGKSTTSLSLAVTLAQTGLRVLLVDADFRHPSLHKELGLAPQKGLVEFLRAEITLAEAVVWANDMQDLHILPMGALADNPAALAANDCLAARLAVMRDHYDIVVIDSAPVLGIAETQYLARLADQTIFVCRWSSTAANTAKHAVRELVDAGATIKGAVLTRVDLKRHARHGFGDAALSYTKYGHYYAS